MRAGKRESSSLSVCTSSSVAKVRPYSAASQRRIPSSLESSFSGGASLRAWASEAESCRAETIRSSNSRNIVSDAGAAIMNFQNGRLLNQAHHHGDSFLANSQDLAEIFLR